MQSPFEEETIMSSKMDKINSIMQAIADRDDEALMSYLTDDVEYHFHVGTRPLIGKEWVQKFFNRYRQVTADVKWEIYRFAETENEVFIEGYEEYRDIKTNDIVAHPYMGIYEFRDGLICGWRDYFEMNNKKQTLAIQTRDQIVEQSNCALEVAERFMAALNAADVDEVRAVFTPDAYIWHNFSEELQSVDENIKTMLWLHRKLSKVNYDIQRREAIPGGFIQQHILRGMLASGETFAMPACAICKVDNGRISSLEEYLDLTQTQPLMN
jgi:limonene-1,2-epoxide hydrolase